MARRPAQRPCPAAGRITCLGHARTHGPGPHPCRRTFPGTGCNVGHGQSGAATGAAGGIRHPSNAVTACCRNHSCRGIRDCRPGTARTFPRACQSIDKPDGLVNSQSCWPIRPAHSPAEAEPYNTHMTACADQSQHNVTKCDGAATISPEFRPCPVHRDGADPTHGQRQVKRKPRPANQAGWRSGTRKAQPVTHTRSGGVRSTQRWLAIRRLARGARRKSAPSPDRRR